MPGAVAASATHRCMLGVVEAGRQQEPRQHPNRFDLQCVVDALDNMAVRTATLGLEKNHCESLFCLPRDPVLRFATLRFVWCERSSWHPPHDIRRLWLIHTALEREAGVEPFDSGPDSRGVA